ncbi:translocation/assembly module TamB domain-containing protein [Taibaiella koreensis]|uniref:translocation/assembly module TamB domain-containing protein n=1 Tax=Taibaiella koreensis TaxID=1268548 RepID=UPI000E59D374|nr:translocation/assembly module TamB domain-containing protein [Taibaiella koreensis]
MRRFFRIILYIIGSILLLVILIIVFLQTPWGKNFVRQQAVKYLRNKLKTELVITKLDYSIPDKFLLEGVLLKDRRKDTLLSVAKLQVNMDMLALLKGKVAVDDILLEGVNAHVYRPLPDTVFNYNFIIEAFAGNDTAKQPEAAKDTAASKPLDIDIAKVVLKDIRLRYDDATGGTYFSMNLGGLTLRPKKIDLQQMKFEVKEFSVTGLQSYFATDTSYLPPPPKDTTPAADFQLAADKVRLDDIKFAYLGKQDSMYFGIQVGMLETAIRHFGLQEQLVQIDKLQLENVASSVAMGKPKTAANVAQDMKEATTDSVGANNWRVLAGSLMLKEIGFVMDNNAAPRQAAGMDYAHMNFQHLSFNGEDILYSPDTISGNLKHLALSEQSGLSIIELRTRFLYCNQGAQLNQLYLQTPGTLLQDRIGVSYPSLATLEKEMNKMRLDIAISNSKVSMKDVLLFLQPEQRKMLAPYATQQFRLAAQIKGFLNALAINDFNASGLQGTVIALKGRLNGLPDTDKLNYDLNIATLRSTYADIAPFLPDSLKRQVRVPEWFSIKGLLAGTAKDYRPDLEIHTADGDATVKGALLMSPGEGKEQYDLALTTNNLNLGRILRQDSLFGKMTLKAAAKGTGFDVNKMNTTFDADIASVWAMQYNYNSIHLGGTLANKVADIKGNSTDPNVNFTLTALADLSNKYPALKADLSIGNFDPQALNLYSDTLRIKGDIHADFESLNPDYPSGTLTYASPQLHLPGYDLRLDSIIFRSKPDADSLQNIYLDASNVLYANLTGHMPLTQIGNAALSHINNHYRVTDSVIKVQGQYDMTLNANAVYRPLLKTWLPDLKPFDSIKLAVVLNPTAFNVDAYVPKVIYGKNRIDSGVVKIYEAGDTLRYGASLKRFTQDQFALWYPSISGSLRKDSVYARVRIADSVRKDQFALGAAIYHNLGSDSALTYIRMFKGILLDYDRWDVNPQNRIVLGPQGFYIRDFAMSKDNQSIQVNSEQATFRSPFTVSVKNFLLSNVTRMISRDTLVADGYLNVNANIDLRDSFPRINASAEINQLVAFNQPVGDLKLTASNATANMYDAHLQLNGNDNNVVLDGRYFLEPVDSNQFKFDLVVNALSLKSLQGFSFGSIRNSSGFIRGNLNIAGTTDRPKLLGELHTDQLTTTVSMLNAPFTMPSETIRFAKEGILLNHFTIKDRMGKAATIDGRIRTRSFTRYNLNLNVKADHWEAVNSTKKDNELFYGKLIMSTDLNIKGQATAPKIDGELTIHDSTRLTYAMIDNGPGIQESDGIVRFIDSRDTTWVDSTQIITARNMRLSRAAQMNVNVGIEEKAIFNVVIDPVTGDNLQAMGEANLNTFIGPDGAVGLTGTYELKGGYYELHYNFLRKKFDIQSGSVITLSGDPLDAEVDITAVYAANIAPYELMEKQSTDPAELNYFKQRLPFQVLLKLKGKVMKPDISFDIVLPEDKENVVSTSVAEAVQRKLADIRNDPSILNKQVFAALILGRFITDDPFASGAGGGMEYAARQSASRFLSDQLNAIAGQLVQGFELNVGLESSEDYSTGDKSTRTDLNITASKRLFSDRLKVTVGNDFQLEGQQAQTQQSSLIPGNLSLDYMLTRDGRYQVRGYRVNQLQNLVDGYVVETGLSFRLNIEYNKFKYIFRNWEKYRKKMQEQRARQQQGSKNNGAGQ